MTRAATFGYEADGAVSFYYPNLNPTNTGALNAKFRVNVRDDQWQICLRPTNANTGSMREIVVGSTNNAEIYALTYFTNNTPCLGVVESNGFPDLVDFAARFVWIGLCSHAYRGQPTDLPPYIQSLPALYRDRDIRRAWSKAPEPPHLAVVAVYYNWADWSNVNRSSLEWESRSITPLPGEMSNACSRVVATTNLDGLVLPTRWVYERYSSAFTPSNWYAVKVDFRAEATTDAIRLGNSVTTFIPTIPAASLCMVKDFRLQSAKPPLPVVLYVTSDGRWKPVQDLRKIHARTMAGSHPRRQDPWFLVIVLFFGIMPPLAWFARQQWMRRQVATTCGEDSKPLQSRKETGQW